MTIRSMTIFMTISYPDIIMLSFPNKCEFTVTLPFP